MLTILLKKVLLSRKATGLMVSLILKLTAGLCLKWGIDAAWLEESLNEWLPVFMTWLAAQGAVDVAKELRTPAA